MMALLLTHPPASAAVVVEPVWCRDTWTFHIEQKKWYSLVDPKRQELDLIPTGRMHATSVLWQGAMFMFGGDDGGNELSKTYYHGRFRNDIWMLNVSQLTSTSTSVPSKLSWVEIRAAGNSPLPSPRTRHSAIVYKNQMIVFGGYATKPNAKLTVDLEKSDLSEIVELLNDVWSFDFKTRRWKLLLSPAVTTDANNNLPQPRMAHSAVRFEDTMIVYGGFLVPPAKEPSLNDTWSFDLRRYTWKYLPVTVEGQQSFHPRGGHTSCMDAAYHLMFVFGGGERSVLTSTYTLDDLWVLNLATSQWSPVRNVPAASTVFASNRFYHVMTCSYEYDKSRGISRSLYLHGGESYRPHMYFSDVWKVNISGKEVGEGRTRFVWLGLLFLLGVGAGVMALVYYHRESRSDKKLI